MLLRTVHGGSGKTAKKTPTSLASMACDRVARGFLLMILSSQSLPNLLHSGSRSRSRFPPLCVGQIRSPLVGDSDTHTLFLSECPMRLALSPCRNRLRRTRQGLLHTLNHNESDSGGRSCLHYIITITTGRWLSRDNVFTLPNLMSLPNIGDATAQATAIPGSTGRTNTTRGRDKKGIELMWYVWRPFLQHSHAPTLL
jgi:hypothetical protein